MSVGDVVSVCGCSVCVCVGVEVRDSWAPSLFLQQFAVRDAVRSAVRDPNGQSKARVQVGDGLGKQRRHCLWRHGPPHREY